MGLIRNDSSGKVLYPHLDAEVKLEFRALKRAMGCSKVTSSYASCSRQSLYH